MLTRTRHILIATAMATVASAACADVVGFTDYEEWKQAVGSYETIDFTGWPEFTIITDQYADMGVMFTDGNDNIFHTSSFVKDGEGLHGSWIDKQITVVFDTPQLWIGIDHPGLAAIDLYSGDELIGSFKHAAGGVGLFTGVLATVPFDRARIHREPWWPVTPPAIDDLHWGVPAPGAVGVFALALLLGGSRRRRG